MKHLKMIGIAVAAVAVGSLLMTAGSALAQRGAARAAATHAVPAEQPADLANSPYLSAAVATAQEATPLPQ